MSESQARKLLGRQFERARELIQMWNREQEKICPNCGHYCHGKSVFCLPPPEREDIGGG